MSPRHNPWPTGEGVPAAEMANRGFDDARVLGEALVPLVGDLPMWRGDGEPASLAFVDSILREHFRVRAETLAIDPEVSRSI